MTTMLHSRSVIPSEIFQRAPEVLGRVAQHPKLYLDRSSLRRSNLHGNDILLRPRNHFISDAAALKGHEAVIDRQVLMKT